MPAASWKSGEVACTEWTNYTLAVRFKAAAMGVPFLPVRSLLGTDTFRHSAACVVACPFTGEKVALLPALYPDVAAIHVHEADRYGNCRIRGTTVADLDLARAAKRLIITCERLIPSDDIRQDPSRTVIPFFCVDAVCEVPFGSYPGNMPYEYFSDEDTHPPLARRREGRGDLPALSGEVHLRRGRLRRVFAALRRSGALAGAAPP